MILPWWYLEKKGPTRPEALTCKAVNREWMQKEVAVHRRPRSLGDSSSGFAWRSAMRTDFGVRKHMGNGFPYFAGMPGIFSKGLFNGCHLDVKKGPVKRDIGFVIKSTGIAAGSTDSTGICRPFQLVGQSVQPADHRAEKIQGAAAVLIEGAHQLQ